MRVTLPSILFRSSTSEWLQRSAAHLESLEERGYNLAALLLVEVDDLLADDRDVWKGGCDVSG